MKRLRPRPLTACWYLLVIAFVCGGAFEVMDNLLGLRTLNFESSAPAVFKIAKELVIALTMMVATVRWGTPRLSMFGLYVTFIMIFAFLPQLFALPTQSFSRAGLFYFIASIAMLFYAAAVYRPGMEAGFARKFLLPVIVITLATQVLEAQFAPSSLYSETNALGLDRRAGIAAIPTTAGVLGVIGFVSLRGVPRLLSVLVIGMANSSLSMICLVAAIAFMTKRRIYLLIGLPWVVAIAGFVIATRPGIDASISTRLDILADTAGTLRLFGPSQIGALATAKSVALAPFDSVIVDSFYLEVLHVCGIVPGVLLVGALLTTIYRRAGALAFLVFAISGVGFLTLEAWIVWISILFGLRLPARVRLRARMRERVPVPAHDLPLSAIATE